MTGETAPTDGPWARLRDWLEAAERPGAVVWVGPGHGEDLPACLATAARRVVLVEPNPAALPSLRAAAAGDARVQILPRALATHCGPASLHVYNMGRMNSLMPASGHEGRFPGLRELATVPVEAQSPAALLADLALDDAAHNLLVLEAPGIEAALVEALCGGGTAGAFSALLLRTPADPMHAGADLVGAALTERLASAGWRLEMADDEDPAFPFYLLRLDRAAQALAASEAETARWRERAEALQADQDAAQARTAELETALAAAEAETVRWRERAEALQADQESAKGQVAGLKSALVERDGRISALEETVSAREGERDAERAHATELSELRDAQTEEILSLRAETARLAEAQADAEAAREAAQDRVAEAERALAERDAERARATELAELREAQTKEILSLRAETTRLAEAQGTAEAAREAAQGRLAEAERALAERDARIAALEERVSARDAERTAAENRADRAAEDLRRAQTLQGLARTDFDDLRDRYRTLAEEKAAQDRLIADLVVRLDAAARHLQALPRPSEDAQAADPAAAGRTG